MRPARGPRRVLCLQTHQTISIPILLRPLTRSEYSRRSSDDITVLERVPDLAGRDEPADVRHIRHEPRALLVRDLSEPRIVPLARVRGRAADDEARLEEARLGCERREVDELRGALEAVGERLEVDRGGSHFFLGGLWG